MLGVHSTPHAEFIALLYLKRSYIPKVAPIGKNEIEELNSIVEKLWHNLDFYYAIEHIDTTTTNPKSKIDELRYRTISYEMNVRNSAYYHHSSDVIRELFTPNSLLMETLFGFNIDEALALSENLVKLSMENLRSAIKSARADFQNLHEAVVDYKVNQQKETETGEKLISELSKLSGSKLKQYLDEYYFKWVSSFFGLSLSIKIATLSERTNIPLGHVDAFFKLFSCEFGSVNCDYRWPSPTHLLQKRPIIKWDGNYVLPFPYLLIEHMRHSLEDKVKNDSKNWQIYQKSRGQYLEQKSMELLSKALGNCEHYSKLRYPDILNGGETELDGLILFDNKLLLVECKAATLSESARRGGSSVVNDLKEIVVKAHDQALRARDYINREEAPSFRLPTGAPLVLDKAKYKETFLITVSLDSLTVFSPILHKVADLGIFNSNELPWAVCLTDLRVISELTESPSMFIDFLKRRLDINRIGIIDCNDETDWFGHYLHDGLDFSELLKTPSTAIHLASYSTEIDNYYLFEMGARKTLSKKPSQFIPTIMRKIINYVESTQLLGFSDAVSIMLDMNHEERKQFEKSLRKIIRNAAHHNEVCEFSEFNTNTKTGITVISSLEIPPHISLNNLTGLCGKDKSNINATKWLFLAIQVGQPSVAFKIKESAKLR